MAKTIIVKDFTEGIFAISSEDGEKIYFEINKSFLNKEKVILDFSGIEITITAFLNSCIGKLYANFSSEEIKNLLTVKNLNNDEKPLLKFVIDKAKERFGKINPNDEDKIDLIDEN